MRGRALGGAAALVAAMLLAPGAAGALEREWSLASPGGAETASFSDGDGVTLRAVSADGRRGIVTSREHLTAGDTDGSSDLDMFELTRGKVFLIPFPPGTLSTGFERASADARTVAFVSDSPLVAEDDDGDGVDVYLRRAGRFVLASPGDHQGADFKALSEDGSRVIYSTNVGLHEWRDGKVRFLANTGFAGASRDARRVFLVTADRLRPSDTDDVDDIYRTGPEGLKHVSIGSAGGNSNEFPVRPRLQVSPEGFAGWSADGTNAYIHTRERLTKDDRDEFVDLYEWDGRKTRRVSQGPKGGNGPIDTGYNALTGYRASSTAGDRVLFHTRERLTADDRDKELDLYERHRGTTRLLTRPVSGKGGAFAEGFSVSRDARRVMIWTAERLTKDDRDKRGDIFLREGDRIVRVTKGDRGGNGDFGFNFHRDADEGRRIFFFSEERLVRGDRDDFPDLHEWYGGRLTRVTARVGKKRVKVPWISMHSADGRYLWFETGIRITPEDRDVDATDVFVASPR